MIFVAWRFAERYITDLTGCKKKILNQYRASPQVVFQVQWNIKLYFCDSFHRVTISPPQQCQCCGGLATGHLGTGTCYAGPFRVVSELLVHFVIAKYETISQLFPQSPWARLFKSLLTPIQD